MSINNTKMHFIKIISGVLHRFKNTLKSLIRSFNEKKYELILEFLVMIVGILLGFRIEGWIKNHEANKYTRNILNIFLLETQYNNDIIAEMYKSYFDKNLNRINISILDDSMARKCFEDANIYNVIEGENVSLLRSYIYSINLLNASNNLYLNHINKENYDKKIALIIRNKVKEDIANFAAVSNLLQKELKIYFDRNKHHENIINLYKKCIKEEKHKILNGTSEMLKKKGKK